MFFKKYILAPLIVAFYWVWSKTWRLQLYEHPEMKELLGKHPVCFAHWHGDELVVVSIGPRYKSAAMTSTSKDGELMNQVLKLFGFGLSRGSSTRGGARALLGMVKLIEQGYSGTVAVDGPKGPIYKVKPGIWHIAKHTSSYIIPTGVYAPNSIVFKKAWNKTFLPLPFSKVVVRFGKPLPPPDLVNESNIGELQVRLENILNEERTAAMRQIS